MDYFRFLYSRSDYFDILRCSSLTFYGTLFSRRIYSLVDWLRLFVLAEIT